MVYSLFSVDCYSFKNLVEVQTEELLFPPTIIDNPKRLTIYTGRKELILTRAAEGPDGIPSGPDGELDYRWEQRKDENSEWKPVQIVGDEGWRWIDRKKHGSIKVTAETLAENKVGYQGDYRCKVSLKNHYRVQSSIGRLQYFCKLS